MTSSPTPAPTLQPDIGNYTGITVNFIVSVLGFVSLFFQIFVHSGYGLNFWKFNAYYVGYGLAGFFWLLGLIFFAITAAAPGGGNCSGCSWMNPNIGPVNPFAFPPGTPYTVQQFQWVNFSYVLAYPISVLIVLGVSFSFRGWSGIKKELDEAEIGLDTFGKRARQDFRNFRRGLRGDGKFTDEDMTPINQPRGGG